ncbi:MAG: M50 family metallopeptidase [Eubacteriales bacterium]|nr:M50 family metallopeptidase [Eubacteriales bacterium]
MSVIYILLAIVLLGILIMVHEFGHFAVTRLCGIAVKEFSIGFGPKIWQRISKKTGTAFSIRPIPLGGYCMFYGDTDDDPKGESKDDPRNYNKAAVWKRMLSVAAGPLMNFVLAFAVAIWLMAAYGMVAVTPQISDVESGMPAETAGLRAGDVFLSVNGQEVADQSVQFVSEAIGSGAGETVEVTVNRDGEQKTFTIIPTYDSGLERYRLGVTITGAQPMPSSMVVPAAWEACKQASVAIVGALGKLVTTGEGLDQTAGPVGVVQLVAEETRQGGLEIYLSLIVMISINLGLMNLIPIPGLDGSRLVFMLLEALRGRPVSQRIESSIHLCGYVLLFGLMIFFTFKDVLRIFGM